MVTGALSFRLEEEDRFLGRLAHQVTGIILSSGNLKKSITGDEVVKSIYQPYIQEEDAEKKERELLTDPEEVNKFVRDIEKRIQQ